MNYFTRVTGMLGFGKATPESPTTPTPTIAPDPDQDPVESLPAVETPPTIAGD